MSHALIPPRAAHTLRRGAYFAHLWIGLVLGLYFVLMGLTGCLLLFENEVDVATHKALFTVRAPTSAAVRPLDTLVADITRRHPGATISAITLPQTPAQSLRVGFFPPGAGRGARREAFVNPYTGAVLGERPAGGTFFPWVLRLHRQFLLQDIGQTLNRYGVLFLTVLLVSGLWLWWPSVRDLPRHFQQRITVPHGARGKRLLFGLHNMIGFYASLLLLVICVTAASYFWKPQAVTVVSALTGTPMVAQEGRGPGGPGGRESSRRGSGRLRGEGPRAGQPSGQAVSYATVLASAGKVFPKLPVLQISRGRGGLRVTKAAPGAYGVRPRLITLTINERDGSLQSADLPDQSPRGLQVMNWLMPIHEGEWGYGSFFYVVKALHLLTGLSPLMLFVTGLLMWAAKRRGKFENQRKRRKQGIIETPVGKAAERETVLA